MEYTVIERASTAFQQSVTHKQLIAMCQRAFGEAIAIESAHELDGGLYNNTYHVQISGMPPVILRVSPHPDRQTQSEHHLMRNEYASQPFLAPIAPLLPKILMADFTHHIVGRDYLFQTFMEGQQWAQIAGTLTSDEQRVLWQQLGSITRKIHAVQGTHFGSVLNAHSTSWSQIVMEGLMGMIHDLVVVQLDISDISFVLAQAQEHRNLLDEITQPRLLHGDLWTANVLVKRDESGPRITAILDCDRTSWGDPMADWMMFLLYINAGTEVDAFWETYSLPEQGNSAQFRFLIYRAAHLAGARLEQHRLHHSDGVKRSYRDMQVVIEALNVLLQE